MLLNIDRAGGDMYWASVHVNVGYMYAEGGGQGAFPGAMQKAAHAFTQVSSTHVPCSQSFVVVAAAAVTADMLRVCECLIRELRTCAHVYILT